MRTEKKRNLYLSSQIKQKKQEESLYWCSFSLGCGRCIDLLRRLSACREKSEIFRDNKKGTVIDHGLACVWEKGTENFESSSRQIFWKWIGSSLRCQIDVAVNLWGQKQWGLVRVLDVTCFLYERTGLGVQRAAVLCLCPPVRCLHKLVAQANGREHKKMWKISGRELWWWPWSEKKKCVSW